MESKQDLGEFWPAPPGWYLAIHTDYPIDTARDPRLPRWAEFNWNPVIGWARVRAGTKDEDLVPVVFTPGIGTVVMDKFTDCAEFAMLVPEPQLTRKHRRRARLWMRTMLEIVAKNAGMKKEIAGRV